MKKIELPPLSWPLKILVGAYLVMWLGGIGHYVLVGKPPLDAPWAASLFLLLAGLIVLLTSRRNEMVALIAAAAIGFLAEILGVRYGFIFSPYSYTKVLIPHLFDVPVVMLSAWMVLVAYARQLFAPMRWPAWVEAVVCAAWMTAIDLVIDPLAANQLGYWRWVGTGNYYGIPFHNFAGWFVVSLIIFLLIRQKWVKNTWALYVGISIVIFFTAIALSHRLWLAGGIGLGLCVLSGFMKRQGTQRDFGVMNDQTN